MKTRPQSTLTKLQTEGGHAGEKPIMRARSRYAKKYTLHVYAKRSGVLHWDLSDKDADTEEVERVAVDAAAEMKRGDRWFGTVWVGVGVRCIRPNNTTAQWRKPRLGHVV